MSAATSTSSQRENENTIEQGATPLELFFDLLLIRLQAGHELPLPTLHLDRDV